MGSETKTLTFLGKRWKCAPQLGAWICGKWRIDCDEGFGHSYAELSWRHPTQSEPIMIHGCGATIKAALKDLERRVRQVQKLGAVT